MLWAMFSNLLKLKSSIFENIFYDIHFPALPAHPFSMTDSILQHNIKL